MRELPSGWETAPISHVVMSSVGGMWGSAVESEQTTAVRVIRGAEFRDWATARAQSAPQRFVPDSGLASRRLEIGDIVLEVSGGGPTQPVGRTVLIDELTTRLSDLPLICSNFCRRLVLSHHLDPRFVSYQFDHLYISGATNQYQRATTNIRNLQVPHFLDGTKLAIPPRAEQERIVAAVEEQFSRLDAAVAALARGRENVMHMKSALLRDSWDAAMAAAGGLSRVVDLLESPLANGRSVPDGPPDGFPVLRLTCVRDGMIDDTETKAGAWTAPQAKQYLVREGDFLVVRGNGSRHLVGRGGIVMRDAAVAYPDTLIRIRPHPNRITARFLGLLWNSSSVRVQLENSARTTAGIYKINQQSLGRIELPVPARDIQAKIVSDADRDLSRSHLLEAEIADAIGRTSRLRSAILLAAFSGKLVPHDPSDEPASVLLERIRAERARSDGHKAAVDRKPQTPRRMVPA